MDHLSKALNEESFVSIERYNNNFDLLRIVAALLVFYSHAYALFGLHEPVVFAANADHDRIAFGTFGVTVFFIISGFLVTSSYAQYGGDLKKFFVSRILRIWPAYIVHYLVVILVIGAAATTLAYKEYYPAVSSHVANISGLLFFHIDPLPGVFAANYMAGGVNGSLRTLQLEAIMYGLLAFIITRKFRLNQNPVLLYGILYWTVITSADAFHPKSLFTFDLIHCWSFLLGSLLYIFRVKIPLNIFFALAGLILLVASRNAPFFIQLYPPIIAYAVVYIAFHPSLFRLSRRLRSYGDYSYGIYLYAWPVQQYSMTLFPRNFIGYFASAVVITLCFSLFSWNCVEKYALRFKLPKPHRNSENCY